VDPVDPDPDSDPNPEHCAEPFLNSENIVCFLKLPDATFCAIYKYNFLFILVLGRDFELSNCQITGCYILCNV
jgi:hypothetical protein